MIAFVYFYTKGNIFFFHKIYLLVLKKYPIIVNNF